MAIRLSDELRAAIRRHAGKEYPHECCGAMLGTVESGVKVISELQEIENTHEEAHERRYSISPDAMFRIEKHARATGLTVLGFYHSHPDHPARPSDYDREWAWPSYSYVIVSVERGIPAEMTCWQLDANDEYFEVEEILK